MAVAIVALTAAAGALLGREVLVGQEAQMSVWEGVYTEEQAARGKVDYLKACASCHRESLGGDNFAPPLAGNGFVAQWSDQSLGDLLSKIRTTMPLDSPGSLSTQENVDILAYLLQANRFPPAKEELKNRPEILKGIVIKATK